MNDKLTIPDEVVVSKIYYIRDQKVMLDRDLAGLYGVEAKVLKQAVRRNLKRFPEDFMFEMTKLEFESWRSQIVTSKADRKGLRYAPFCFTEQGVTMLSCILNSDRAIAVNIRIIRVVDDLFNQFKDHLESKELIFNEGQPVDASFTIAPRQRNTREGNEKIKNGEGDDLWNDEPHKKCHKDIAARWTQKNKELSGANHEYL